MISDYKISWDNQNNIIIDCSQELEKLQDPTIQSKVTTLANHIRSDILQSDGKEINQLNLSVDPLGALHVTASIDKEDIELNLHLPTYEKEAIQVADLLKRTHLMTVKGTEETQKPVVPTFHHFDTQLVRGESRSGLDKVKTFFQRFFTFHLYVQPPTVKIIQAALKDKSPEEMKKFYANPQDLFENIKENVKIQKPEIATIYNDNELDMVISKLLINEINSKLTEAKLPKLSSNDIYRLDIQRVINHAKETQLSKEALSILLKANPMDIPLEELASIPVSPDNKEALTEIWNSILATLFTKGNLSHLTEESNLKGVILQEQYIKQYIKAVDSLPLEIRKGNTVLTELNAKVDKSKLENFIIQKAVLTGTAIDTSDQDFKMKQEIYNEKIKGYIESYVNTISPIESKDATSMIDNLIVLNGTEAYEEILELVEIINNNLEGKEKSYFPKSAIVSLIFNELERVAASEYGLTSLQLQNLREFRNNPQDSPQNITDLLFNEKVFEEVETTEPSTVLSGLQQANLMRITKMFSGGLLTPEAKDELKELLNIAKKDKELKSALKKFEQHTNAGILQYVPIFLHGVVARFAPEQSTGAEKLPAGITEGAVVFLNIFLSQVKDIENLDNCERVQKKMENLIKKYKEDPKSVKSEDRMTIAELGVLSHSARLNKTNEFGHTSFSILRNIGFLSANPDFQRLSDASVKSKELLNNLDNLIRSGINGHYKDGDLLAYNSNKKEKWTGHSVPLEEKLTSFIADGFTHGAKLTRKHDEVQISHIYGRYEQEELELYHLCISDVWEMDLAPLVSKQMKVVLEDRFGRYWATTLNAMNQEVEHRMHARANQQFSKIGNYQERRVLAGLADHPTLFSMSGKEIEGHKRSTERDFESIHAKFFGDTPPQEEQICSEWASKASLAAIMETNKLLVEALKMKYGDQYTGTSVLNKFSSQGVAVPADVIDYLQDVRHFKNERERTLNAEKELIHILKHFKEDDKRVYSDQDIELIIRLGNEEIIDLPYSKKERMKAIHPGRMVSLLVDKKCAIHKPPPKVVSDLIAV